MIMLSCVLLCLVITHVHTQNLRPIANTTQGWVQGVIAEDGDCYAFYGIHYGGDVSGTNRFKPPTPPPMYSDEFEATEKDIICAQPSSTGLIGVEDCLRLSIFSRRLGKTVSQPVLVWLIGEDFATSNPLEHSYRRLVKEDLVVVAVNYRVSIFGFLCLGTDDAPGNAGLRDVMQALEWIQKNIAEFGGNPNNIVLIGHGSGAAMVDFITLLPLSRGLVHKAVAMSGSAFAPWAITRDPVKQAFLFAQEINYETDDINLLTSRLVDTDASDLAVAINSFQQNLTNTVAFAPCIDKNETDLTNSFLSDTPINLLKSDFNQVPYLYIYTDKEGTIRADHAINHEWLQKMEENFADFLPVDLTLEEKDQQEIRDFYFGENTINLDTIQEYLDYHGDSMIVHPVIWGARQRGLRSFANLYLLEFSYMGTNNSNWEYPTIPLTGVPHGQVLNYLLDFDLIRSDGTVSLQIVNRFVAFANTGDPNAVNTVLTWYPLNNLVMVYLRFYGGYSPTEVGKWQFGVSILFNPQSDMRRLWEPLYLSTIDDDDDVDDSVDVDDGGDGDNGGGGDNGGDGDDNGDDGDDGDDPPSSSVERVLSFGLLVVLCQVLSIHLINGF